MNRNKPAVLIVAGGGDLNVFGQYMSNDYCPAYIPDGIKRGNWDRRMAGFLHAELFKNDYAVQIVNPGPVNQSRKSLIGFINDTVRHGKNRLVFVIEITSDVQKQCNDSHMELSGYTVAYDFDPSRLTRQLAHGIIRHLDRMEYKIPCRGTFATQDSLLNRTSCPAITFHAGFITSKKDVELLQRANEQKKIINAIVGAIESVID